MWSLRRLLSVRQTGTSLPILEVCGFRFRQYSGSGDHIYDFSQIIISDIAVSVLKRDVKLQPTNLSRDQHQIPSTDKIQHDSNDDFVFNGE